MGKEIDLQDFTKLYNEGIPYRKLAKHLKCSPSTIQVVRKKIGLPMRKDSSQSSKVVDKARFNKKATKKLIIKIKPDIKPEINDEIIADQIEPVADLMHDPFEYSIEIQSDNSKDNKIPETRPVSIYCVPTLRELEKRAQLEQMKQAMNDYNLKRRTKNNG